MTDGANSRGSAQEVTVALSVEITDRDGRADDSAGGPPVLPAGTRVGRYVVESVLGRGGMGVVYAAHDQALDRRIALKLVRGDHRAGTDAQQRLLREAQAIARLSHPNIVEVFEVGQHEDELFLAMALVEGTTLRRWLADERRDRARVLEVLRDTGAALAAAHAAGLVHRDFKPDNVMVGRDGRVRVLDFGLARQAAEVIAAAQSGTASIDDGLTRTGTIMGTPAYMAPEQFVAGVVDARSDQFAFCVVATEALTGARPFRGNTLEELAVHTSRGETIAQAWRGIPRRIARALRRGLAPEPAARWPDMLALVARLREPRGPMLAIAGVGVLAAAGIGSAILAGPRPNDAGPSAPWIEGGVSTVRSAIATASLAAGDRARTERTDLAAVSAFERAYFAALDAGRDDLATRAAAELASIGAVAYRERWRWAEHAEAALARDADDGEAALAYARGLCALQRDSGALEAAAAHCSDALSGIPDDPEHAPARVAALQAAATVASAADDRKRARDLHRDAVALAERTWGTEDPRVADAIDDLGLAELALGNRDDARRLGERSLAIRGADETDVRIAGSWRLLAAVDHAAGEYDSAVRGLTRALARLRATLGEDHPEVAETWQSLALSLERSGDKPGALDAIARAAAIDERLHPLDIARIPTLRELARMAYEFGAGPTAGREHLERAWEIVRSSGVPLGHPLIKDLDHGYGETLLALGEAATAVPYLERFVADTRPNAVLPHVEFVLGRALWKANIDRGRARAVIEHALATWSSPSNDFQRSQVEQMREWLAATDVQRSEWDESLARTPVVGR